MGQIHEIGKRMNITELAEAYGRKPDTLWRKAKKELPHPSGGKWSLYSELTEDEQRILLGNASAPRPAISAPAKPAPPKQIIRTDSTIPVNQPAPAVENTPAPGRAKIAWPSIKLPTFHQVRRFTISALLFAVVVMHGLLIWYDCAVLWDIPGQIGGATVFIVVLAALLLASDATLPRTSGNALAFIFFVDCAAWKVHFEVFKTPVVDNVVTGSLCAFICAASFIALYLFRDSKLD